MNHPRFQGQSSQTMLMSMRVLPPVKSWRLQIFHAPAARVVCSTSHRLLARLSRHCLHLLLHAFLLFHAPCGSSSSSMHHVDRLWLYRVSLGLSVQVYSRPPWTFNLTFTSHHWLPYCTHHLHFTSQVKPHTYTGRQSLIISVGVKVMRIISNSDLIRIQI